jgi:hypothetical protein
MGLWLAFPKALPLGICLTVSCLPVFMACSDPQAENRARLCKGAGVSADLIKECRQSGEDYKRIMEPITAQRERLEIAEFNKTLKSLPTRSFNKDQYETTSLVELSKVLDRLTLGEETRWNEHHPFGRRLKVHGELRFHATDFENKLAEHTTLSQEDLQTSWQIEADLESLTREERGFVRTMCGFLSDPCVGEFFGLIEIVTRDKLPTPGLQIEYMEIKPRKQKESS